MIGIVTATWMLAGAAAQDQRVSTTTLVGELPARKRDLAGISHYVHQMFTLGSRKLPWVSTMNTLRQQLRAATEAIFRLLFSGGFMLVWLLWLCCWPVYRVLRSHTVRS